jgi:uncharacterized membrane protein
VVASAIAAATLLISAYPSHPKSLAGWLALYVFALPIYFVGEWIGSVLFENRFAKRLEDETAEQSVSIYRIVYGVLVILAVVAVYFVFAHYLFD